MVKVHTINWRLSNYQFAIEHFSIPSYRYRWYSPNPNRCFLNSKEFKSYFVSWCRLPDNNIVGIAPTSISVFPIQKNSKSYFISCYRLLDNHIVGIAPTRIGIFPIQKNPIRYFVSCYRLPDNHIDQKQYIKDRTNM